jgi:hypothetical protein
LLPNIDFSKHVKISPNSKEENGKTRNNFFIMQGGHALKQYFTKENPNGLPPMVPVTVKGKTVYDNTEQLKFIEKMINEMIVPRLPKNAAAAAALNADTDTDHDASETTETLKEEKLPF